jgi:hypothetical protein
MARKKKHSRIVIPIIVICAIVVAGSLYFFPRFMVYVKLIKERGELGKPRRLEMQGEYDGETEHVQSDWISLYVPLLYTEEDEWVSEYDIVDDAEITTIENKGIKIILTEYKKEPENNILHEDDRGYNFGAETQNEANVMMYKNTVGLPTFFQSVEDINTQGERYIWYNSFHEDQKYGFAQYESIAYTISNAKKDEREIYYISLYDVEEEYELIGNISVSYELSANTKLVVEPSGILAMIQSIEFQ